MTDILIIEDDLFIRENILELLQSEGYQVSGASTGAAGIQLIQEHLWDLIICDIMLPDTDGYSILEFLRQNQNRIISITQLVFLTAKAEREDLRLGMEMGADDYITKPCSPTELLSAIAARLHRRDAYLNSPETIKEIIRGLQQKVQELQRQSNTNEALILKIAEELRHPISNINLAIKMLTIAPSPQARDRYIQILQQECSKEFSLLNQIAKSNHGSPELTNLLNRFKS
jgi:two-component system alkaline phosphatase synthesis response regulator PhoP